MASGFRRPASATQASDPRETLIKYNFVIPSEVELPIFPAIP
jgi:hypothetical protein